ncbi:efflux RND transporter periplasmic adaptor subunit [bacterium]|nr:efflux RND transporter periplasmic adaptor subunit [bacterium]
MAHKARIAIVLVIVIAAVVVTAVMVAGRRAEAGPIRLSGNIEVTDTVLSFKLPGRISERLVEEGELVSAGQLVARLESTDQEILVAQAEANVALAEAVLAELEAGSRPEQLSQLAAQVDQARAALSQLENGSREQDIAAAGAEVDRSLAAAEQAGVQLDLAAADYRRSRELFDQGVIPAQQLDAAQAAYDAARRGVEAAEAGVARAREMYSLALEGPRSESVDQARAVLHQAQAGYALAQAGARVETIEQAEAQLAAARAGLEQARTQLAYTQLLAPFDGVVLSKGAEPGEYVNPGTAILALGQLDRVWLRVYAGETELTAITLGQAVQVTADGLDGRTLPGRISYIASQAEFTPKAVQTRAERTKLVYLVKVELDNPDHLLKLGMPADVVITRAE